MSVLRRQLPAIVGGVVVFLVLMVLTISLPPNNAAVHVIIPALLGALYYMVVLTVTHGPSSIKKELLPDEEVISSRRYHPVKKVAAAIPAVAGFLLCSIGIGLALSHSAITFRGYHANPHYTGDTNQQYLQKGEIHHIYLWYFPTFLGLACLVLALWAFEKWRCNYLVHTNQRLIQWQYMSLWLAYPIKDSFDPEPNSQMSDVDDSTGILGKRCGWGTIVVKVLSFHPNEPVSTIVLRFVPGYKQLAYDLRLHSPFLNQQLRNQGIPPTGLSLLPPSATPPRG